MFSLKEVENKVIVLQIPSCLENPSGSSLVLKMDFLTTSRTFGLIHVRLSVKSNPMGGFSPVKQQWNVLPKHQVSCDTLSTCHPLTGRHLMWVNDEYPVYLFDLGWIKIEILRKCHIILWCKYQKLCILQKLSLRWLIIRRKFRCALTIVFAVKC